VFVDDIGNIATPKMKDLCIHFDCDDAPITVQDKFDLNFHFQVYKQNNLILFKFNFVLVYFV
jgi:hypothetical protein